MSLYNLNYWLRKYKFALDKINATEIKEFEHSKDVY